jgi:hypothetical protein
MDVPINARVSCSDGPCGETMFVILKPTTEKLTHLVVHADLFPDIEYMVPIDQVADSTPRQIRLHCTRDELSKMRIFDKVEFVPSILPGFSGSPYLMWPYFTALNPEISLEKDHIPVDELVIRRGARVQAADGPIGRVDEFLVNPADDVITHLVMREGHLWGQKDVTIPVGQIDHYKGNTVYLKLNKTEIERLPTVPVQRAWPRNKNRPQ